MKKLSIIIVMSLVLSSCHTFFGDRVKGDGNVISQVRDVKDFGGVETGGGMEVIINQDSGYAVKVEADNNLQEFIEVYVDHDMLHVYQRKNTSLNPTGKIKVYVSAPHFKILDASGASSIRANTRITSTDLISLKATGASKISATIDAPQLKVDLTGASSADLTGTTRDLTVDASGSSDVSAYELLAENTNVHLTGASEADVYASVKLEAEASGASNVRYRGNAQVNQHTSGAGSVKKGE